MEDAHLISAINWQPLPLAGDSRAPPQGRPSVAARATRGAWPPAGRRSSTGRSLCRLAGACRGVGGRRKYVICGVTAN